MLASERATLAAQNDSMRRENAALVAGVAELERRLGLNSSNSSKPPSADGLSKKPRRTRGLRERSDKPAGGQPGHPGKTLCAIDNPDHTVDHLPANCANRAEPLPQTPGSDYDARQVFDLRQPQPLVANEHRARWCPPPSQGHAQHCLRFGDEGHVSRGGRRASTVRRSDHRPSPSQGHASSSISLPFSSCHWIVSRR
jgi:hypothetical protein